MCVWFTEWSSISIWISVLGLLVVVMNLFLSSQGNGFWIFGILTLNCSWKTLWWFGHDKKQSLNTYWVQFPCPSLWLYQLHSKSNPEGDLKSWVSFQLGSFPNMAICIVSWVAMAAKERGTWGRNEHLGSGGWECYFWSWYQLMPT